MGERLVGKVAVITGSTSGIGAATAARFHQEGARVVVSGRNETRGRRLVESLGTNAVFCAADVMVEEDIARLVAFAVERFGRLDVLFNNAGGGAIAVGGIEEIAASDFAHDMLHVVGSVLFGMKHAVPHMRRQKAGSIINNASIAAHRHGYGAHVYSAAKAAVVHLTRCVAMEVAEHSIRVNSISAGAIVAPSFFTDEEKAAPDVDERLGRLERFLSTTQALPLAGMPHDVANAALYLASDEARYVTAHDLVVDAGKIAGPTAAACASMWERLEQALRGP